MNRWRSMCESALETDRKRKTIEHCAPDAPDAPEETQSHISSENSAESRLE